MSALPRIARGGRDGLAALGALALVWAVAGFAVDLSRFDRTSGGYDAPYVGWTGTPMDWSMADVTPTGMARRGIVANTLVDCTSGMITVQAFGIGIPFRPVSPRAIAVHKPREACAERGFDPAF